MSASDKLERIFTFPKAARPRASFSESVRESLHLPREIGRRVVGVRDDDEDAVDLSLMPRFQ